MQTSQRNEFEQRRSALMRKHIENDPKLRAVRRKRRLSVVFSVAGSLVTIAVVTLLIKSFLLAVHGPQGYAQMVAPVLYGQDHDSFAVQLLGVDPLSTEISAFLRPMLPAATDPVATNALSLGDTLTPSVEAEQSPEI